MPAVIWKPTPEELKTTLADHALWRKGKGGKQADLGYADLRSANLGYADLGSANLGYADLRYANLWSANLWSANLGCADLRYANLGYADLGSANLGYADLRYANLWYANLGYADLGSANLWSANLGCADLRYANNADLAKAQTIICPEGSLIVWKKCANGMVVKLRIPEGSRRSCATGRKCRADFADVLGVFKAGSPEMTSGPAYSLKQPGFIYRPGQRVQCDKFDENRFEECAGGIHFFLTREEAEAFTL